MASPMRDWTPSSATSGMTHLPGQLFTDWQGDLLVTALISLDIRRLRFYDDTIRKEETLFAEFGARPRDVRQGLDVAI